MRTYRSTILFFFVQYAGGNITTRLACTVDTVYDVREVIHVDDCYIMQFDA